MGDGPLIVLLHEKGGDVDTGRVMLLAEYLAGGGGKPVDVLVAVSTLNRVGTLEEL